MKLRTFIILILAFLSSTTKADDSFFWKDNPFCILNDKELLPNVQNLTYKICAEIRPFDTRCAITGLSINGFVEKTSPEYLVRVILTDVRGNEYLVMELYEELNDKSRFTFSNYCEESGILDSISPDCIKIIVKDATLYISEFFTTKKQSSLKGQAQEIREAQIRNITDRINSYNATNNRLWLAGETEISKCNYTTRKMILGLSDSDSSGGLEYYLGGIFQFGHSAQPSRERSSNYVDHFDWRSRHGKNWITSVKYQGWSNFCTVFAGVGCLEAMTNLYYNKLIDLNLSEQEVVDCADTEPHYGGDGFDFLTVLNYLTNHGICLESDYPQNFCFDPSISLECLSNSITPQDMVSASGDNLVLNIGDDIKGALIAKGPMLSGWNPNEGVGHAMVLVGYGTLHAGDSVYYYNPNNNIKTFIASIDENDSTKIGATYLIFKNSYGTGLAHQEDGYISIMFPEKTYPNGYTYLRGLVPPSYLKTPINSLIRTDNDIVIEDEDGDGYYNWGIGPKPSSCPSWIPNERDGDDSDPTIHFMDTFGNFPEVYTFPLGTDILLNNSTISINESLINNLEINHDVTLTITGAAYCLENVKIKNCGGTIIVDGGVLANADIELVPPCSLIIRNGGSIYMKKNKDLIIPTGCVFEIEEGQVCKPYCRK